MSRWKTRNHSHWVSFQYSKVKLDSNTYNVGIVLYITHTQQRVRASDKLARWLRSAAMQLRRLRLPAMCTIICEAGWGYWTLDMFRLTNLIVLIRLTFCADMGTNLLVGCLMLIISYLHCLAREDGCVFSLGIKSNVCANLGHVICINVIKDFCIWIGSDVGMRNLTLQN